ncbi:MAG: hypothetical protein AMS27_15630, partial [Bacteroides sp. SM23_62_1]
PVATTVISGHGTVQTITLTADDGNGNTAQCTFNVTLSDTINPTISCLADRKEFVDAGDNFTLPDYTGEATASDNCCPVPSIAITQNPIAGTIISGVGTTQTITLTANDGNGNTSQCTFDITLSDSITLNITCPGNRTEYVDNNCDFIIPDYTVLAVVDDTSATVTQSPVIGTVVSGHGSVQIITLIAENSYGDTAQCTFDITLLDTVSPTITCPDDRIEYVDADCSFTIPDFTALAVTNDNCGAVTLSQVPISGTAVTGHGTMQPITLTANDGNGNITLCQFNVTLADTTPPIIVCQDVTVPLDITGKISITASQIDNGSTDNCDIDTMYLDKYDFTCADVGVNSVVFTVEDMGGNSSVCIANVNILDTVSPSVTCPADIIISADPGDCSAIVTSIAPTATDNCSIESVRYDLSGATIGSGNDDASGEIFKEGVTNVTYQVYDKGGNVDSCSFIVTVTVTSEPPDLAMSDRDTICAGDGNIVLTYSGGTMTEGGNAQWYDDPVFSNHIGSGNDLVLPAPVITTTYYVRFEGVCDTTSGVSVTVVVMDLSTAPVSATSDRDTVCSGDGTIILSYTGGLAGPGAVASWYTDATFTNQIGTGNNLPIAAPTVETTYYVRLEGVCDTTAAVQVTVHVYPVPDPQFITQTDVVCPDSGPVVYAVSGLTGSGFNWTLTGGTITNNLGDSVYIDWGNQVDSYQLTVVETSKDGCISSPLTIDVLVTAPTVDLGDDQFICDNETAIITPTVSSTVVSLLWHDGTSSTSYMTDTTELVSIMVFDQYACSASDSVQVTASRSPVVNLGNDTILCGESSLLLDADNAGDTYEWSTGETAQTITVYKGRQDIWVVVTNEFGCLDRDTISIYECSVKDLFANIPNTITPNGDNVNDTWYFDEALLFPDIEIEIFDRWGQLVWRSEKGYPEPWDGRSLSGREMPMDSYYYVIELNDGSEQVIGTITIVR